MICKNCGKKVYAKEVCDCGEKAPNVHGKGVAFNSIVCTIIIVLSVFALITTVSLRNIVNKNLLVQTIEQVDLCSLEMKDDGKTVKLDKYIYDEFIADERITVQNVDNILNAPFIKEFVIEKIEGYQDFFMDRGDMEFITSDDIVNLIDENGQLLYNEAGLEFLEADKANLKQNLSGLDYFSDFCNDYLTGWFTGGLIQTYFSVFYVGFLEILLLIVLIQWLMVYRLNGRRMSKALEKYSIAVMIPALIVFIASMLLFIPDEKSILGALTMYLRSTFIISSAIILGTGIILNIISTLTGPKKIKKKASVKAVAVSTEAVAGNSTADWEQSLLQKNENEENAVNKKDEANNESAVPNESFAPVKEADNAVTKGQPTEAVKTETAPAEEEKPVFCTKCGHKNRRNSSFCAKCGTKLRL